MRADSGPCGQTWAAACETVAAELGVELVAHVIGPGRTYTDLYDDWSRVREVAEEGCVLVRPDGHVAWRSAGLPADPAAELRRVLGQVLAR